MLNPANKVYGPNPRARNIMLGVWLLFAGSLTLSGIIERDPAMVLVAGIFSAIMLPIVWLAFRATKLVLTADGIELRQAGAHVSTPWSNVAAIRTQRGAEGLILHQPMTGKGAEGLAAVSGMSIGGAPMYGEDIRQLLHEKRFISLNGFSYWLHKGDLHEAIKARSTTLSSEPAQAPDAASAAEKTPRSRIALMLALGIYACANGVAAVSRLRARQYGWFVFSLLLAMIQALIALAALGSAIKMLSGR